MQRLVFFEKASGDAIPHGGQAHVAGDAIGPFFTSPFQPAIGEIGLADKGPGHGDE